MIGVSTKQEAVLAAEGYGAKRSKSPLYLELQGEFWAGGALDWTMFAETLEAITAALPPTVDIESQALPMARKASLRLSWDGAAF